MRATVFQDLTVCILSGALLALSAHRQLRDAPSIFSGPYFRETVAFAFLIFLPTGLFFYVQWPDWSWLYFVDPGAVPAWLAGFVLLTYPLAVLAGFVVTAAFARGDSPRIAWAVPAGAAAGLVIVTAVAFDRFLHATTYERYQIARGGRFEFPQIWESTVWIGAMLGAGIFVGVPLLYLIARNLRPTPSASPSE